jgi:hypothetical protein
MFPLRCWKDRGRKEQQDIEESGRDINTEEKNQRMTKKSEERGKEKKREKIGGEGGPEGR